MPCTVPPLLGFSPAGWWREVAGPRPADAGLNVPDTVMVELDLHLVVLHLPPADRTEPSERPPPVWHHPLPAIDQRPRLARGQPGLFLGTRAADLQHVVVRSLAGPNPRQRLRRGHYAAFAAPRPSAPEMHARPQGSADPPSQQGHARPGHVSAATQALHELHEQPRRPAPYL